MHARSSGQLQLSATDLSAFAVCRHRTGLDLAVALGLLERPRWSNPASETLIDPGRAHEQHSVDTLRSRGQRVVDVRDPQDHVAETMRPLAGGVAVVFPEDVRSERVDGMAGAWDPQEGHGIKVWEMLHYRRPPAQVAVRCGSAAGEVRCAGRSSEGTGEPAVHVVRGEEARRSSKVAQRFRTGGRGGAAGAAARALK